MNGKINGIYKSYWKNGQLNEEVNYNGCELTNVNSKRIGQLWREVNYIDGKKNGIYKSYYENGQLYEEVNYIDGKKC